MIKNFLTPPVFAGDEDKTSLAGLLHRLLLISWGLPGLVLIVMLINPPSRPALLPVLLVFTVLLAGLMVVNRTGRVMLTSYLFISLMVIVFSYVDYQNHGTPRPLLILAVLVIIMSGLLLGSRAPIIAAIIQLGLHAAIVAAGERGLITTTMTELTPLQNMLVTGGAYLANALFLQMAISRIQVALARTRESQQKLETSNIQLQDLTQNLEKRVEERTLELTQRSLELSQRSAELTRQSAELENLNAHNARRATQFQAVAAVSHAVASVSDLEELLPQITRAISDQFGFYHTGIFLTDEAQEFAVLSAANSEGGQRMLKRGHRLKIGQVGIVGNVVGSGKPRIALDTGKDAVFFENPDLPETRSEMALPLHSGQEVIGALDVQSTEAAAFNDEDVEVLTTLADQVSIAIQNARQFQAAQKSLSEAETIYRQFIRKEWSQDRGTQQIAGYHYSLIGTAPIHDYGEQAEAVEKIRVEKTGNASTIAIPITLRGEIIGVLDVKAPEERTWNQDEIDIAQAVADRVAVSAENARLFEETTSRAERERTVSEITSKIRSTNDPNQMIQIALNELKQALQVKDVQVSPYLPPQSQKEL
jgi:GAF domain-containing protein